MEISSREQAAFGIHAVFERVTHPARGRDNGQPGANGRLHLASGATLKSKGFQVIATGEHLIVEMPGGGGYGEPSQRDPERVATDVRNGLVSRTSAERDYKVILRADYSVDQAATAALRQDENVMRSD
jgi:N-methylhydantoinase B